MSGTYVAVRVHPESEKLIRAFLDQHNIPVAFPKEEQRRHATIMYSRDDFYDDFVPEPQKVHFAVPKQFAFFPTKEGHPCLVLLLNCQTLSDRHEQIKQMHGCTYSYPEFKPHISFTYDVGDTKLENIPPFYAPIILSEEYKEALNEDWAKK